MAGKPVGGFSFYESFLNPEDEHHESRPPDPNPSAFYGNSRFSFSNPDVNYQNGYRSNSSSSNFMDSSPLNEPQFQNSFTCHESSIPDFAFHMPATFNYYEGVNEQQAYFNNPSVFDFIGESFNPKAANFAYENCFDSSFPTFVGQQQPNSNQFPFNYSQEGFQTQGSKQSQGTNWESFDSNSNSYSYSYSYSCPYSYAYEPVIMYAHIESKIKEICEFYGDLIDSWEHRIQSCIYQGIVTTEEDIVLDRVICEVKRVVPTENLTDPLLFNLFDPAECVDIEEESIQLNNPSHENQPSQSSAAHWQPLFEHSNSNSDNIVIIEDVEDSEFDFESNLDREKDWEDVNDIDDGGNGANNNHVFLNIPTLPTDENYTGVESKSNPHFNSPFQGYNPSAVTQNEYSSVFKNECFSNSQINTAESPYSSVINTADSSPLPSSFDSSPNSFDSSPNSFIYSPNLSIVEETEEKEEVIPFASPVSPVLEQSTSVEDFVFASIPFDAFEREETEVDANTNSNLNSKSSVRNSKFLHLFFPTSEDGSSHGKGDERMNSEASDRTSNGENEESKDRVNSSSFSLEATLRCSSSESEMNSSTLLEGSSIILDSDDTSALKSCPSIDKSIAFQESYEEASASNPSTETNPADGNASNHVPEISDEFTQKTVQSFCSNRLESILSNRNASSVSDDENREKNIPSFDAVISSETSSEIASSPTALSADSSSPKPFFAESSSAGASFQASRSVPAIDHHLLSSFEDATNEFGLIPNSEVKESPLVEMDSNSHETLLFNLEISSPAHTPATETIDHFNSIPSEGLSDFALPSFPEFKLHRSRFCFAREENQPADDAAEAGLLSTPHNVSTPISNSKSYFAQEENQHTDDDDDDAVGLVSSHNFSTPRSNSKLCFAQEENQPADDAAEAGLLSTSHNVSTLRLNSKFCFAQQTVGSEPSEMQSRDTSASSFPTVSTPCEKNVESDMDEQMLGIQLEMDVNRVVENTECSMNEQKNEEQCHKEEKDKQQICELQKNEQQENEQGENEQAEYEQQRECQMGRRNISFPLLTIESRTTSLSSNPASLEGNYPSDSPLSSALYLPPHLKDSMDEEESSVQIPFESLCELDVLIPCGFGMESSSASTETTNFESCERTCRAILCTTLKLEGSTSIVNPTVSSLAAGNSAVISAALAAYDSKEDNEAAVSMKTPLTYGKNARTRALSRASPVSCIKNMKKEVLNVEKQNPNAISSLHTITMKKKGSNESNELNEKKPGWSGAWNNIRSWMFSH